jgi:hypothetical protein
VRTTLQIPQQSNDWDCGIYLVVSLIRAIATENDPSSSPNSRREPIDGPFYRILFTDLLMAYDDARTLSHVLVAPDDEDCNAEINIAARIRTSRKLRTSLDLCETYRQSALQLFSNLASALGKASARINTDIEKCNTLLIALADSKHTIQRYGQRSVSNGNETHENMEKMATATKGKAQRSASLTNDAANSTQKVIARLQSLGNVLSARRAKLLDTVHAQQEEARKCRDELREQLVDLDKALASED